jgi:hypothetical protein
MRDVSKPLFLDPTKPWDTGNLSLPWRGTEVGSMGSRRFRGEIYGKMNVKICTLEGTGRANTEAKRNRIVQAVNSFDVMLAALKAAKEALEASAPLMPYYEEPRARHDQALLSARAAIKLAEGK